MAFMSADAAGHADKAEINITPLVDVMLVLLIIFLVAAPMVVRTIDLPLQSGPTTVDPPDPMFLQLRVDAAGELILEGRTLSLAALDRVLQMESSRAELPILQIEVALDADYARMTEVLALARNHGLNRLELRTP
jgi:biopolymer transport protein ExbD